MPELFANLKPFVLIPIADSVIDSPSSQFNLPLYQLVIQLGFITYMYLEVLCSKLGDQLQYYGFDDSAASSRAEEDDLKKNNFESGRQLKFFIFVVAKTENLKKNLEEQSSQFAIAYYLKKLVAFKLNISLSLGAAIAQ